MTGTKIAQYEINEKLGEGGMGVVYRARDTKLDREVAFKVLLEEFAREPSRMERFEREAHVLASLNHPHIASIYGLEESKYSRLLPLHQAGDPEGSHHFPRRPDSLFHHPRKPAWRGAARQISVQRCLA